MCAQKIFSEATLHFSPVCAADILPKYVKMRIVPYHKGNGNYQELQREGKG